MANERRDGHAERRAPDGASSEEALERTLTTLGPLLRRRAQVDGPRRAFVAALRSHLLSAGSSAPPAGSTHRRDTHGRRVRRLSGGFSTRSVHAHREHWAITGIALAVALLALLALGAVARGRLDLALLLLIVMVIAVLIVALIADHGREL